MMACIAITLPIVQDPLDVKLLQLLVVEILGGALCLLGVLMSWHGLSGRSTFLVEGAGLKAKLTNATPGLVITIIGAVLVWRSLDTEIVRQETQAPNARALILANWLERAGTVTDHDSYVATLSKIASGEADEVSVINRVLETSATLGELSVAEYGDARFWILLAVANKDRGLFLLKTASVDTLIPASSVMEVWRVSKRAGLTRTDLIRVAVADREAFYTHMLELVASGRPFDGQAFLDLDTKAKEAELGLAYRPVVADDDTRTLGELALKFYGSKRFWPLAVWTNHEHFAPNTTVTSPIREGEELRILFLLPDREE